MASTQDTRDKLVTVRATPAEAERMAATAKQLGTNVSDLVRESVQARMTGIGDAAVADAQARAYVQDPCPYTFDGNGPSLARDHWNVATGGGGDALDRMTRFNRWQHDPRVRGEAEKLARAAHVDARFAVTTANTSTVIPPGYLANFLPPTVARPLFDAATRRPLTGSTPATPFSVPSRTGAVTSAGAGGRPFTVSGANVTGSGAIGTHAEGQAVADGSLTIPAPATVTPAGKSGLYKLTRELLDASNPQADQIALSVMREEYARQCEAMIYAELNGANGQGGTITGGRVPSGAWVSTGITAATAAGELKGAVARTPFRHPAQQSAASVVCNEPAAVAVADLDTTERWMQGVTVAAAPAMSGQATTDGAMLVIAVNDLWCWESPLLTFRYEDRAGPALIELAVHGYFACRLLRPSGLSSMRMA